MKDLKLIVNPKVTEVFNTYPNNVRQKLEDLRTLIIATANSLESVASLEETLKWGEPSYLTKYGSTIRINWKSKVKTQYAMYFQCTSKLVPTFRLLYKDILTFEGSRAIVFELNDAIPKEVLTSCITAALTYHKVKHLPTLGL